MARTSISLVSVLRWQRPDEQHAFPSEVWRSPNARDEPPSDPRGVIRIARKLYLKNSILRDGAMEQKRQREDHNERGREPRSERGSACRYDEISQARSADRDGPGHRATHQGTHSRLRKRASRVRQVVRVASQYSQEPTSTGPRRHQTAVVTNTSALDTIPGQKRYIFLAATGLCVCRNH